MALKLPIELSNGLSAEYFKIRSASIDFKNNCMQIVVDLYKDSDASESKKQPVQGNLYFNIQNMVDIRDTLYGELKKLDVNKDIMTSPIKVDFTKAQDA